ncbi:SCO family protein [Fodinibius saliphilus]|uniref:SCO family protein n=1 Tax=Fodinibius saliphilus TaxID=1920650 RepID=UPI0011080FC8|nr:SCO family protein [Fodinibius saliphilus]
MKKVISLSLLAGISLLPATLVIGFSYLGKGHPLENKTVAEPFFLSQSSKSIEVVFWGYAGCDSICPVSLKRLGEVLKVLKQKFPQSKVGAVFVNVAKKANPEVTRRYGRQFSKHITGGTLTSNEMREVHRDFNVRFKSVESG